MSEQNENVMKRPEGAVELFIVFSEPGSQPGETKVGIAVNPAANPKMLIEILQYAIQQFSANGGQQGGQLDPGQNAPLKFPTLTQLIKD